MNAVSRTRSGMANGFTLIELLVVMAMVAILARIAVPSLSNFASNQALTSVTSDLMNSVITARNTAVTRNRRTIVQPLTGTDWASGWRVYIDVNSNGQFNEGTDELVSEREAVPSGIVVQGSGSGACVPITVVGIGPDGFLTTISGSSTGGIGFSSQVTSRSRCVVVTAVGRPRTCGSGGGATAC